MLEPLNRIEETSCVSWVPQEIGRLFERLIVIERDHHDGFMAGPGYDDLLSVIHDRVEGLGILSPRFRVTQRSHVNPSDTYMIVYVVRGCQGGRVFIPLVATPCAPTSARFRGSAQTVDPARGRMVRGGSQEVLSVVPIPGNGDPRQIENLLLQMFPDDWLRTAAADVGFVQRQRKIDPVTFFWV